MKRMPGLVGRIRRTMLAGSTAVLGLLALAGAVAQAPRAVRPKSATPQPIVRFVPESVSVYAGLGFDQSSDGILGTDASFRNLFAIAFDSQGNLYMVDSSLGLVRRVNAADGTIVTVAGVAPPPYSGGESRRHVRPFGARPQDVYATDVTLNAPHSVAVDSHDLVYFTDTGNNVVYRVDPQGILTVIAGTSGQSGYSPDGTLAVNALLKRPAGLAIDPAGNVYIADTSNNVVRRVSAADGTIATVAGSQSLPGGYSADGFPATQAQLNRPNGLAFDLHGNLLIADTFNCIVRKVDAGTQIISTIVGNHTCGFGGEGGLATDSPAEGAYQIAVDSVGQLYVGGTSSGIVRKVDLNGRISAVAGFRDPTNNIISTGLDGPATQTIFDEVNGVAVDSKGSLYLVGYVGAAVFRIGPGALMSFGEVAKKATATQTLTVENLGNAALNISGFSLQGAGFSAAPAASGGCAAASVLAPGGHCDIAVTFSPTAATTYSATLTLNDDAPDQPQTVPISGTGILAQSETQITLSTQNAVAGDAITLSAVVTSRSGNGAIPTGTVLFQDNNTGNTLATATLDASGNTSVTTTIPQGSYYLTANYQGDDNYQPSGSSGTDLEVAAQTATVVLTATPTTLTVGGVISADAMVTSPGTAPTGKVEFRIDGTAVATATLQGGHATGSLPAPGPGSHTLVAVYLGDNLYGAASSNAITLASHGALLQFTPGSAVTLAGTPSDDLHGRFSGDGGPATSAFLHTPYGVTTDGAGNVYIADEENNVIRRVGVDGTITTVAGTPYVANLYNTVFSGDGGPAVYAYLDHPTSVVVDGVGNLYIADYSNNVIRKVTAATGIITTIAGNHYNSQAYNGDGTATSTQLYHPAALAMDKTGILYIADTGNNLVRRLNLDGTITTVAGNYYSAHNGPIQSGVNATSTFLYNPFGVAVDATGNLFISDTYDNAIRKVDLSGIITTVGGNSSYAPPGENVPATASSLTGPQQMAFDLAGNLYFAEAGAGVVRKIDTHGILTTAIGFSGSSPSPWSHFDPLGEPANYFQMQTPAGVAVAPDGSLLTSDTYNQTVIRSGPDGALLFGPLASGATSDPQTIQLSNVGDSPLVFATPAYTVTGDYSVTSACDFTKPFAPGATCNLQVAYANTTGALSGALHFSANVAGSATVQLKTLATAVPSVTVLYAPNSPSNLGDNLVFIAFVSAQGPPAKGNIAFYDGSTLIGTVPIGSGYAALYYSGLAVGTHSITARYLGNGIYAASVTDPQTLEIIGASTSTALTVSSTSLNAGALLTLGATITTQSGSKVGSGSVSFFDGTTLLASRNVSADGQATFSTSTLAVGTHALTAAYVGNAQYGPSTSPETDVTIAGGGGGGGGNTGGLDYSVQVDGLPLVLHRGETGTVVLTYNPAGYDSGVVIPSCGTLPDYATCSFSTNRVVLSGGQQQTVVLTISTTPLVTSAQGHALTLHVGGTVIATVKK